MNASHELVIQEIRAYVHEHECAPSVRDIAEAVHLSPTRTHAILATLRNQRRVDWVDGKPRTIRILETETR